MGAAATNPIPEPSRLSRALLYGGAFALTIVLALALAAGAGLEGKAGYAAIAAIAAAAALPVAIRFAGRMETVALLALGTALSISLKFHLAFRADHIGGAVGYRVAASDLLVMALMAWLALGGRGRFTLHVPTPLLVSFGIYTAFAMLSTVAGGDVELGLFQLSALLQAFGLFVFLLNYLTTRQRFRTFVVGLLAGLALQSSAAMVQVYRPGTLQLSFLGAPEIEERRVVQGRIDLPEVDRGTTMLGGSVTERPTGILLHPNVLALYLVTAIPLALGVWIAADGLLAWFAFACAGLGSAAMYYTLSRSGWAGLAFALVLGAGLCVARRAARLSQMKAALIALALVAAAAGVAAKADVIIERLTATAGEAVDFRASLNRAAIGMLAAHPATGVGLNSFVNHVTAYDSSGMSRIKPYPVHNLLLMEFAETGVAGGLAFVALVAYMFRLMWGSAMCCGQRERAFALIAAAGVAGFFLSDMTNFVYRMPVMTQVVWAQVAVVAALGRAGGEAWWKR